MVEEEGCGFVVEVVCCCCTCLLLWEPTGKWFHFSFFEDKHDHMVHAHPQGI